MAPDEPMLAMPPRQEKTNKRGVKNKRLQCALDPDYLLKVLANTKF